MANTKTVPCEYCKEQIRPDALKCKHCGAFLEDTRPTHNGTCPWCKESIHRDAKRCKHCKTDLVRTCDCEHGSDGEDGGVMMKPKLPGVVKKNGKLIKTETCADGAKAVYDGCMKSDEINPDLSPEQRKAACQSLATTWLKACSSGPAKY